MVNAGFISKATERKESTDERLSGWTGWAKLTNALTETKL
jgi:hypothetical protein